MDRLCFWFRTQTGSDEASTEILGDPLGAWMQARDLYAMPCITKSYSRPFHYAGLGPDYFSRKPLKNEITQGLRRTLSTCYVGSIEARWDVLWAGMCSGACSLVPSTCYLFLEACCGPWWAGQMRFGDPLTHAGSVNVCSGHPSMHAVSLCWFSWALDMLALGLRLVCLLFWVYSHKRIMYVYVCVHVIH